MEAPPVRKKVLVERRRRAREKGDSYVICKGKTIPAKNPPPPERSCSCKYQCKNLSNEQKLILFMEFYKVDEKVIT
ncbi:hypothetical protein J6590_008336 [Homalodisca vitripennis]|nr:hypothetical protein J6590_008336 [Homalodisca vitripennis]